MMTLVVTGTAGYALLALTNALVRRLNPRIEGREGVPAASVEQLEARVAELEQAATRMVELEERVDFAERLLARQRSQSAIGPGE